MTRVAARRRGGAGSGQPGHQVEVTGVVRRRWKALSASLRADLNLVVSANRVALLNARLTRSTPPGATARAALFSPTPLPAHAHARRTRGLRGGVMRGAGGGPGGQGLAADGGGRALLRDLLEGGRPVPAPARPHTVARRPRPSAVALIG